MSEQLDDNARAKVIARIGFKQAARELEQALAENPMTPEEIVEWLRETGEQAWDDYRGSM